MPLWFNTNVPAIDISRYININQQNENTLLAQITSGHRISSASIDPAGLAEANNLSAQLDSMSQAQRNAGDAVSLTQVADGSLEQMGNLLSRMRELAVESSTGTGGTNTQTYLNNEFVSLRSEIDRISATTSYNNKNLLDGTLTNGVSVQVGINGGANQTVAVTVALTNSTVIGNGGTSAQFLAAATVDTVTNAQNSLATIDQAINQVSAARASLGGNQARLQVASDNLASEQVNYTAAIGRIQDVDIAQATADLTKNQILVQAGMAVLAQAISLPAAALSLITRATGG